MRCTVAFLSCLVFILWFGCLLPAQDQVQRSVLGDQPVVLYDFNEGQGNIVHDISGVGQALDLTIQDLSKVTWTNGGLWVTARTLISSSRPADKIIQGVRQSGALTVEMWIRHPQPWNNGPARIWTISANGGQHDLAVDVEKLGFDARVRTDQTNTNGKPQLETGRNIIQLDRLYHVVVVRNAQGQASIYIDGKKIVSGAIPGSTATWDQSYVLSFANEVLGNRHWRGEALMTAFYTYALGEDRIIDHFQHGENGWKNLPPTVTILSPTENSTHPHNSPISFQGSGLDTEDGDLSAKGLWQIDGRDYGRSATLSVTSLSIGAHRAQFAVTDAGGLSATAAVNFTVTNTPPVARITAPLDGTRFPSIQSVVAIGVGEDFEDGIISANGVWTLDGQVRGNGTPLTLSGLAVGQHQLTYTITDSLGLSASANVSFEIFNSPPSAAILSPSEGSTHPHHLSIAFQAQAIDSEEGDLSTRGLWQIDGQDYGRSATLAVTGLAVGSHRALYSVTDTGGLSATAAVSFLITNAVPVASITTPQNGDRFPTTQAITATGVGQDLEDGTISNTGCWILDGQVRGSGASISLGKQTIGQHQLTFVVTDSLGLSATASVLFEVFNLPPTANILLPTESSTHSHHLPITFQGQGLDPEEGDLSANGYWQIDGQDYGRSATLAVTGLTVGPHRAQFTVTDSYNLSASTAVNFLVTNAAPVARITAPLDGDRIPMGRTVVAAGSGEDLEDGDLTRNGIWTVDGQVSGTGPVLELAHLVLGVHQLQFSVRDSLGLSTTASISIEITNTAPNVQILSPAMGAVFQRGQPVNVSARALDAEDGDISSLGRWILDGTALSSTGAAIVRSDLTVGNHEFIYSITDTGGLSATAAVTVVVLPPVITPTLDAVARDENGRLIGFWGYDSSAWTSVDVSPSSSSAARNFLTVDGDAQNPAGRQVLRFGPGGHRVQFSSLSASVAATWKIDSQADLNADAPRLPAKSILSTPQVLILAPGEGLGFAAGSTLVVPVGLLNIDPLWVRAVDLLVDGQIVASDDRHPFTMNWTATNSGTHTLIAQARLQDTTLVSATRSVLIRPDLGQASLPVRPFAVAPAGIIDNHDGTITAVFDATNQSGSEALFGSNLSVQGALVGAPAIQFPSGTIHRWPSSAFAITCAATSAVNLQVGTLSLRQGPTSPATLPLAPTGVLAEVLSPQNGTVVEANTGLTFIAAGSVVDATSNDSITQITLVLDDQEITTTSGDSLLYQTYLTPGTHVAWTKVTTTLGRTALSAPVVVRAGLRPTVTLSAPADNTVVSPGAQVTVGVQATDIDGSVVAIDVFNGENFVGRINGAQGSLTVLASGNLRLSALATDDDGLTARSPARTVRINQSPIVTLTSPSDGQKLAGSQCIAAATAADPDGRVVEVHFLIDGVVAATVKQPPYTTVVDVPNGQIRRVQAEAVDDAGATSRSSQATISREDGTLRVAILTPLPDTVIRQGVTISLAADATTTGQAIQSVTFRVDGVSVGVDNSKPYSLSWIAQAAGIHNVDAVVRDAVGREVISAPVRVKVNLAPTIAINSPTDNGVVTYSATAPVLVTMADSDGSIVRSQLYIDELLHTDIPSSATNLTWRISKPGQYRLRVLVVDDLGAETWSPSLSVRVNQPPGICFVSPGASMVDALSNLLVAVNAIDPDGSIKEVVFTADGVAKPAVTQAPWTWTWTSIASGTHTISATAKDNDGAITSAGTISFLANALPTAVLTTPANNTTVSEGTSIVLKATATDSDGSINAVRFYAQRSGSGTAALIATTPVAPYSTTIATLAPGWYLLWAESEDDRGTRTISNKNRLTVNGIPVITVFSSQLGADRRVALHVEAIDPEGEILNLALTSNGAQLTSKVGSPLDFTTTPYSPGLYTFIASVRDTFPNSATRSIDVRVNSPPVVELTSPVAAATFAPDQTVILSANASDADGAITKVRFFANGTELGQVTTTPYRLETRNLPRGLVNLQAVATDDVGATTTSPAIQIRIDLAARLSLISPVNGARYPSTTATIAVACSLGAGIQPTKIEILKDGALVSTLTQTPWQAIVPVNSSSTLAFLARGTLPDGTTISSDPVSVRINSLPQAILSDPRPGTLVQQGASLPWTVTGLDQDGRIVQSVLLINGTPVASKNASSATGAWIAATSGQFTFAARVTDDLGETTTGSALTIRVNAPPTVDVNLQSSDSHSATLAATATDSDGRIVSIRFLIDGVEVATVASSTTAICRFLPRPGTTHHIVVQALDDNGGTAQAQADFLLDITPSVQILRPIDGAQVPAGTQIPFQVLVQTDGVVDALRLEITDTQGARVQNLTPALSATASLLFPTGPVSLVAVSHDAKRGELRSTPVAIQAISYALHQVSITRPLDGTLIQLPVSATVAFTIQPGDLPLQQILILAQEQILSVLPPDRRETVLSLPPGRWPLQIEAIDTQGRKVRSGISTLTVNAPPRLSFNFEGAVQVGLPLTINVLAQDDDGAIDHTALIVDGQEFARSSTSPWRIQWTPTTVGHHEFRLYTLDDRGARVESPIIPVEVSAPVGLTFVQPNVSTQILRAATQTVEARLTLADPLWSPAIRRIRYTLEDLSTSATSALGIAERSPYQVTWLPDRIGSMKLTAIAEFTSGATLAALLTVTVQEPAQAPVDQVAILSPQTNTTYGPDDQIQVIVAVQTLRSVQGVDLLDNGQVLRANLDGALPRFAVLLQNLSVGTHNLSAQVRCLDGQTLTSPQIRVEVLADLRPQATLNLPLTGTLYGPEDGIPTSITVSSAAGNAAVAALEIEGLGQIRRPIGATGGTVSFEVAPLPAGQYRFFPVGITTDNRSGYGDPALITVSARTPVAITQPLHGTHLTLGESLTLTAVLGTDLGANTQVHFLANGIEVALSATAPWTATWTPTQSGIFNLQVLASGSLFSYTSSSITIEVLPRYSVTITTPKDGDRLLVGSSATLAVNILGTPSEVAFYSGTELLGTLHAAPWSVNLPTNSAVQTTLNVVARFVEPSGSVTQLPANPITVTIENANQPPTLSIVNPISGTVIANGSSVDLNANLSDTDGRVVQTQWFLDDTIIATSATSPFNVRVVLTQAGAHQIRCRAIDDDGAQTLSASVAVTVQAANVLPLVQIMEPWSQAAIESDDVLLRAHTFDEDGTIVKVTWFLDGKEVAQSRSYPWSATLPWITVGPHVALATVLDDRGGISSSATVAFTALPATLPPLGIRIVSPYNGAGVTPGSIVPIKVEVDDNRWDVTVNVTVDGVSIGEDSKPPYSVDWTVPAGNGSHQLRAMTGEYDRHAESATVTVIAATSNGLPPQCAITDPVDPPMAERITGAVTTIYGQKVVKGLVTTPNPAARIVLWNLELLKGETTTLIAQGQGSVPVSSTLGTVDGTSLSNGIYTLRLSVFDSFGLSAEARQVIAIEGESKIGNLAFTEEDIVLSVGGLPITITRSYSSLNANEPAGEFGLAWRSSYEYDIKISETRKMTEDLDGEWFSKRSYGDRDGIFCTGQNPVTGEYYTTVVPGLSYDVSMTLPDGRRTNFRSYFETESNLIQGTWFRLKFAAPDSVNYELKNTGLNKVMRSLLGQLLWGQDQIVGFNPSLAYNDYDPRSFELVAQDGTRYVIVREDLGEHVLPVIQTNGCWVQSYGKPRLSAVISPNGDQLKIDNAGYHRYAADGTLLGEILFRRDALGRVVGILDPAAWAEGKSIDAVRYIYDANGRLVKVEKLSGYDAQGKPTYQSTQYKYEQPTRPALITAIVAPDGRLPLRVEYDASGRVVGTIDANGNRVAINHDLVNRVENVTDRLGRTTRLEYDIKGNVVRRTDALGQTTQFGYDSRGNQTSETNALGQTTQHAYDNKNNRTSTTDALGRKTSWTHDSAGRILTETDALGRVTRFEYDGQGNLTKQTDALGNVTMMNYDSRGRLYREVDALGNVTTYYYNNGDYLTRIVDALGNVTEFQYDNSGNLEWTRRFRTLADGSKQTVASRLRYDAKRRPYISTDALGAQTITEYSQTDKPSAIVDALGRRTTFLYDSEDRLVQTIAPDGTTTSTTYDAEGQVTSTTDADGRTTRFEYDAVGRRTATVLPDGTRLTTGYDAVGRVVWSQDGIGRKTRQIYDAVGQLVQSIAPDGSIVRFEYDLVGNQTTRTDAAGRKWTTVYDALNRPVQSMGPKDEVLHQTQYDANGQRIGEIDGLNRRTQFGYDALGHLVSVTDALNQVTRYEYDELSNQVSQIDALGRKTAYEHDVNGRRIVRKLPMGQTERLTYDIAGRLTSKTDFRGQVTERRYDLRDRLTGIYPQGSENALVKYGYSLGGRRTWMQDGFGQSNYFYDTNGRLATKETPQGKLFYTYGGGGELATIKSDTVNGIDLTYAYDANGRLATTTHRIFKSGAFVNKVVTNTFTADGQKNTVTLGNGVVTGYQYNGLGYLTQVETRKSDNGLLGAWRYDVDLLGRRLVVRESTGRSAAYEYDNLDRLVGEIIEDPIFKQSGTVRYSYDKVGNRLSRTSSLTQIPGQDFAYDNNDRILTEGWEYDAAGRTLKDADGSRYEYDWNDRLVKITRSDNSVVEIGYNGDNQKVWEREGTLVRTFLVDDLNPTGYSQTLEVKENGTLKLLHTVGDDLHATHEADTGKSHWLITDGHGSVRLSTDDTGTVEALRNYDAFGIELVRNGLPGLRYGYAGEETVGKMQYLRARWMMPGVGRFGVMDKWNSCSRDPQTLNKFSYSLQNPTNKIDPSGNFSITYAYALTFNIGVWATHTSIGILTTSSILVGGLTWYVTGSLEQAIYSAGVSMILGMPNVYATPGRNIKVIPQTKAQTGQTGESFVKREIELNGWQVRSVQNKSGHGLDIVAEKPSGEILVAEVKSSSVGRVGNLSSRQSNADEFTDDILLKAASGGNSWDPQTTAYAQYIQQRLAVLRQTDPNKVRKVAFGVDLSNPDKPIIRVSPWRGNEE